jgi:hypothetical protein
MLALPASLLAVLPLLAPGDPLAEAEALLAADQAEQALAKAARVLEDEPDDARLLEVCSRASLALDEVDDAIWYATLALAELGTEKDDRELRDQLTARIAAKLPAGTAADAALEEYAQALFRLSEGARRRKLWANAVDLLLRCRGTRFEARANERLDRIYNNRRGVEALLATGVTVPARPLKSKSPEWIAKSDAEHATWEDAYEFKGKNYTVRTNVGWELGQTISMAMEQMNAFYRTVFRHKERGGNMARCQVNVYATRAEFERYAGVDDDTLGGYYMPGENRVETYDPTSDGGSRADLWSTLFHEASHQFTHVVLADLIPGWLNEGTASYFEGARLLPSGSVETNLIPYSRLGNLRYALEVRRPSLKQVVTSFQPGSYDVSYYSVGWGLVYFLRNYEDEACERIYLEPYLDFLEAYDKGGKHDVFERFVEYFVTDVGDPAVPDFPAFEQRFRDWIYELFALSFGGPEVAGELLERARLQRERGKLDAAVESVKWALRKRPEFLRAELELARLYEQQVATDAALFSYRRILGHVRSGTGFVEAVDSRELVDGMTRTELAAHAAARVSALDANLGAGLVAAEKALVATSTETAAALAEAGFPRLASYLIDEALAVIGGHADLQLQRASILETAAVDPRRWRRPRVESGLPGWSGGPWWSAKAGAIEVSRKGLAVLALRRDLPRSYRVEATLSPVGEGAPGFCGLVLGANDSTGMRLLSLSPYGNLALYDIGNFAEPLTRFRTGGVAGKERVTIAAEVSDGFIEVFLDGESGGFFVLDAAELDGRIGLFSVGPATFSDVRLLY